MEKWLWLQEPRGALEPQPPNTLAADGAKVAVNYVKNAEAANQVVQAIEQAGGIASAIAADVADPTQLKQLFATVTEQFGTLHILVNNAGTAEFARLDEIDHGHIERQFDLNVRGLIYACQEASHWFDGEG
jgi:3-oxoacyl-[acyl-carrier protein] reductase